MSELFAVSAGLWVAVNVAHMLGHLLAARCTGVLVHRVSLGVGPTLWSRQVHGITFRITPLPVAFLVRLRRPWSKKEPDSWPSTDPRDLGNKALLVRLVVFCAAPATTLALGYVAAYYQNSLPATRLGEPVVLVSPGMPAASAGIQDGDRIVTLDGQRVERWSDLQQGIDNSRGRPVVLEVLRQGKSQTFEVRPARPASQGRWLVGVSSMPVLVEPPGPVERVGAAAGTVWQILSTTASATWRLLAGEVSTTTMGGPVAVVREVPGDPATRAATRHRFAVSITLVILNYFLLCVFPFAPYLDGRRLLFLGIEAAARRPLHPCYEQWFNRVALLLALLLMFLAFYNDLSRYYMS